MAVTICIVLLAFFLIVFFVGTLMYQSAVKEELTFLKFTVEQLTRRLDFINDRLVELENRASNDESRINAIRARTEAIEDQQRDHA